MSAIALNCFSFLPNEVLTNILINVSTADLLQFLGTYDEYSHLLKEKCIVEVLNFKYNCSNIQIAPLILNKMSYHYVKILNIDDLYWIPLQDIRRLLLNLDKLEEFYARGTSIGASKEDLALYGRLKKLSLSIETQQLSSSKPKNYYSNYLQSLEKLCVTINSKEESLEFYTFLSGLGKLTELWIFDNHDNAALNYEKIVINLHILNKLVVRSKIPFLPLDLRAWGLIRVYASRNYHNLNEIIFERVPVLEVESEYPSTAIEEPWETLKSLRCAPPWGPAGAKVVFKTNSAKMDHLPTEIVIKIFTHVNSYDLIQFCESCRSFNYLLHEKDVIKTIDFSGKFEANSLNLYTFITTNLNCDYIKVLNINYVYWVQEQDLRRLIKSLQNLEVLRAIDTKLGIKDAYIGDYTKLKKLAVSVDMKHLNFTTINGCKNLNNLKSLCLKFTVKMDEYIGLTLFFRELKQLEELWICDPIENPNRINYDQISVTLKHLEKFVIKSKMVLPYYDFSYAGLVKVFECKRSATSSDLVFGKVSKAETRLFSIFEPADNEYERSWQIFQHLHKDTPYGPKESLEIYTRGLLKDVFFQDLNFSHAIILCNLRYVEAALKILSSKNCSKLKRLSVRNCIFQNEGSKEAAPTSGFKRSRRGVQINHEGHPFESIANNLKNLRELEILACPNVKCGTVAVASAYYSIKLFGFLEKLILDVPLMVDGAFLKEVFINCPCLESLYVSLGAQNEKFMINLYDCLKYSQNLKHFRLDLTEISITKLLNSFNEITNKKLLRIFLRCDTVRDSDEQVQSIYRFMESNPQLIFCGFIVTNNSKKQNNDIRRTMKSFKTGNPAKVFYVTKDSSYSSGIFPVPAAHHDIIFNESTISAVNIDDF